MFLISEKSGLQAGHFNSWTLPLRSQAVMVDTVCGSASSGFLMLGLPWNRLYLDGSKSCSFKTCLYIFTCCTTCVSCLRYVIGINATPYHQRSRLDNKLNGPSTLYSGGLGGCGLQIDHFKWALVLKDGRVSGCCSHVASPLYDRALISICGRPSELFVIHCLDIDVFTNFPLRNIKLELFYYFYVQ